MFDVHHADLAVRVLKAFDKQGWRLATAESCTGGLIASCLTAVSGSSSVVEGGIVAYDNRAKRGLLHVDPTLLERDGAVSEAVARAMAVGAREAFKVHAAVAVTGIAGPGGATPNKPVGLVHLAVDTEDQALHRQVVYAGDRTAVRLQTVETALEMLLEAI